MVYIINHLKRIMFYKYNLEQHFYFLYPSHKYNKLFLYNKSHMGIHIKYTLFRLDIIQM